MLKPEKRRALSAWIPVAAWMVVIFFASTEWGGASHTSRVLEPIVHWIKPDATEEQFNFIHFLVRKAAHLTEYAILGLLYFRAFRLTVPMLRQKLLLTAAASVVASGLYACTDEFHQSFVGGRTACMTDALIDSSGSFISVAAAGALVLKTRRFQPEAPAAPAVFEIPPR